jgi:hypothetical protein
MLRPTVASHRNAKGRKAGQAQTNLRVRDGRRRRSPFVARLVSRLRLRAAAECERPALISIGSMALATEKELRAAKVAHVLAHAVRADEINPVDAARILKHELRTLNTNRSHKLAVRSHGAQASIVKYLPERPPRNDSGDALHADHVYPFTQSLLYDIDSVEGWIGELRRLSMVVCVTATENYALEQIETAGLHGPQKYAVAGITFATPVPW